MRRLRATAQAANLAAIGLLVALSIVGAFLGAERAQPLVTSAPLTVYWFALLALLVVCFPADLALVRSPGLAAIHLGAILVLAGSMWASEPGHRLADRLLGRDKVLHGYLVVAEGTRNDTLVALPSQETLGTLPFSVGLRDFRLETYPTERPWMLGVEVPPHPGQPADRMLVRTVPWEEGARVEVPGTSLRVLVHAYLPAARAETDDAGDVVGAAADPGSGVPAMDVEVRRGDASLRGWIVPRPGERYAGLSLRDLLGIPEAMPEHAVPHLYLIRPEGMPKDYFSDLVIIEDGEIVRKATVEVNHPLHHRGYHLYQADYDHEGEAYTVLSVRSDSGLWVVWVGFVLLVAGTFVRCWGERALLAWAAGDRACEAAAYPEPEAARPEAEEGAEP